MLFIYRRTTRVVNRRGYRLSIRFCFHRRDAIVVSNGSSKHCTSKKRTCCCACISPLLAEPLQCCRLILDVVLVVCRRKLAYFRSYFYLDKTTPHRDAGSDYRNAGISLSLLRGHGYLAALRRLWACLCPQKSTLRDVRPTPPPPPFKRSFGRIPSECHPNIMNIVSISEKKLSMVMPAAVCDLRKLLDDKVVLTSMSFAERMR